MIWGSITFFVGPTARTRADLGPDGWACPDWPVYADVLNRFCPYGQSGPADGDPVAKTVRDAVELLKADVLYLRPAESHPDRVY
jgi:hypothetical protein